MSSESSDGGTRRAKFRLHYAGLDSLQHRVVSYIYWFIPQAEKQFLFLTKIEEVQIHQSQSHFTANLHFIIIIIMTTAGDSKGDFPLAGQAQDGWNKDGRATATCFCGAVQLSFVSRDHVPSRKRQDLFGLTNLTSLPKRQD